MSSNISKTRNMQATSALPDLISFDSWESATQSMSGGTVSTHSSLAGGGDIGNNPTGVTTAKPNITVSISGVKFSLNQCTFEKLRQLPWQSEGGNCGGPLMGHNEGKDMVSYSLSTSPELFDILVHHVLFGALPHALTEHDIEELEVMALSLGLTDLVNHLLVMQPLPRRKLRKQASFTRLSKASSLRSMAALKRWSSAGRLLVKERLLETKKVNKWAGEVGSSVAAAKTRGTVVHTHVTSTTTDLA
jgi:hypothetical protein